MGEGKVSIRTRTVTQFVKTSLAAQQLAVQKMQSNTVLYATVSSLVFCQCCTEKGATVN